jgi:hypothetical protein
MKQKTVFDSSAKWIWGRGSDPQEFNRYQVFRKSFTADPFQGTTKLYITADSRYVLYLNGERLGQGPVRSWPFDQKYDVYDLTSRLKKGKNTIAVLVRYWGVSTFQYIAGRGGLLCQVVNCQGEQEQVVAVTDETWLTALHTGYARQVPRICCQLGFEEQFDAGLDLRDENGFWYDMHYAADGWEQASVIGDVGTEPWLSLSERDIPFLTEEVLYPSTTNKPQAVRPIPYSFFIDLRPLYLPEVRDANRHILRGALAFNLVSAEEAEVDWHKFDVYGFGGRAYVNGEKLDIGLAMESNVRLKKGDNLVVVDLCGEWHDLLYGFGVWTEHELEFKALKEVGDAVVSFNYVKSNGESLEPLFKAKSAAELLALTQYTLEAVPEQAILGNLYAETSRRKVVGTDVKVENLDAVCAANLSEAVIYPAECGSDIEILLDFGKEVVGFLQFTVFSDAGVTLDWNCFEGIQEGRWLYTDRLNNTLRYVTRQGRQSFHSIERRGFRYATLTIRGLKNPLRISEIRLLQNTYPIKNSPRFKSSDYLLNSIWEVSRYTSRLCSEDTYVDCPAYEQAFWVGDARNEGLVDYYVNGDYRLAKRCLKLVANSLRRSPLPESQVPSGWQDILTAWSLLWLLACDEYYLHTGDRETIEEIYPAIRQACHAFIDDYLNKDDLLEIEAWNMLDWAPMDTPRQGVVTHQNAWLVRALRQVSRLAQDLGLPTKDEDSAKFLEYAERIKRAINKHLWSEEHGAFSDCRHVNGELSEVISQQTNTVVYLCDCVDGERKEALAKAVYDAPSDWVQIGSPFMMFFSLEALVKQNRYANILDLIRYNWGLMLDRDATTCWEMFPGFVEGRWTRSHCHAWSAAPGYFLPAYQLGVRPLKPGFAEILVSPEPVDLLWCNGVVPTPHGDVEVSWKQDEEFTISIALPAAVPCTVQLPAGVEKPRILKGQGQLEQTAEGRWALKSASSLEIELAGKQA